MDDNALVFNAGSSSLKFCLYSRGDAGAWRLVRRRQTLDDLMQWDV